MQINLLLPAAYSYLCHAEFPSGQTTFRQIGPTRFQFDRPSLPTNRTTSTHYGIPLPPRRTRSHTGRSQLPHRRIGGAGRTFPRTGFPDRTDDRSRRHLDARTGREFPFGPRRAGRHGRGQRRGIEPLQRLHHSGRLRPDPPAAAHAAEHPARPARRRRGVAGALRRAGRRGARPDASGTHRPHRGTRDAAALCTERLDGRPCSPQGAAGRRDARRTADSRLAHGADDRRGTGGVGLRRRNLPPQRRGHRPQAGRQRVGDRHYARGGRHVAARTGLVGRLGRQGPARHRAGQRRGIEHRQHPAHPGALLHRRPAHAGRHRRRDAGCRRPQFAAPLRRRLHLPPPCAIRSKSR